MRALALMAAVVAVAGFANGYWGVGELFCLEGPRDGAMGGATSVPLFLPEAAHANPAGLGFAGGLHLTSSYSLRFGTLRFYSLAAAGRGWGGRVISLDAGELGPDPSYTAYGVVLSTGLALGDVLAVGLAWKGFFQATPGEAFGWALDPAVLLRFGGVHLGLVLENAASAPIDYGGHREPWPWGIRGGVFLSGEIGGTAVTLAANARYTASASLDFGVGMEVQRGIWSLRLGYGSGGLAAGASLELGGYGVHWAIVLHPYLPSTVSVGASWGSGG